MDELQQNAAEFAAAQDKGLKKGKKGGKKSFRRSGFEGLIWIAPAWLGINREKESAFLPF